MTSHALFVVLSLIFLFSLTPVALSLSDDYGELGPPQICRCYTVQPSCAPPSPGPSIDPPSPSPSPAPTLPPNSPCSLILPNDPPCPDTHPCSCTGLCRKRVSLRLSIITDDDATLYNCNGQVVATTSRFDDRKTITLTDVPCDNYLVHVHNIVDSSAVALLLEFDNGVVYGSTNGSAPYTKPGVRPLNAYVTYGPNQRYPGWIRNDGTVPYSDWTSSFVVESLLNEGVELQDMIRSGAWPVGVWNDVVGDGMYGYWFEAPYCD